MNFKIISFLIRKDSISNNNRDHGNVLHNIFQLLRDISINAFKMRIFRIHPYCSKYTEHSKSTVENNVQYLLQNIWKLIILLFKKSLGINIITVYSSYLQYLYFTNTINILYKRLLQSSSNNGYP